MEMEHKGSFHTKLTQIQYSTCNDVPLRNMKCDNSCYVLGKRFMHKCFKVKQVKFFTYTEDFTKMFENKFIHVLSSNLYTQNEYNLSHFLRSISDNFKTRNMYRAIHVYKERLL
jgi:hypothetical protein